ncbi:hypothetical protein I4U23_007119 [Adineta vaga]|nr:hypothetical protein I4U23_007119 [Adineta vaga]
MTMCFLWIIYWIYNNSNISHLFEEFSQKFLINKQKITDHFEYDNDREDLFIPNLELSSSLNDEFFEIDNCNDLIIEKLEKSQLNLYDEKTLQQSTATKNVSVNNDQTEFSRTYPVSQPGYYGVIHAIPNYLIKYKESISHLSGILDAGESRIFIDLSDTAIAPRKYSINDIIDQTNDIRRILAELHEDISQLKMTSTPKIEDLSIEEQSIIKTATENLIEVIRIARNDDRLNRLGIQKCSYSNNIQTTKRDEKVNVSLLSFVTPNSYIDRTLKHSETILNKLDDSTAAHIHHPACVNVLTLKASIPRIPTKTSLIAINDNDDDDDENSYDNRITIPQQMITTNEQFENIPARHQQKLDNMLLLNHDSIVYNTDQSNWPLYSSKSNHFTNLLRSDLPRLQSEHQHSSSKQIFLHHRQQSTLLTSSINASNNLSSDSDELYLQNNINASDCIESFNTNLKSLQISKTVKQRTFRVRKSRIIVSFDDFQQQRDGRIDFIAGDNKMNNARSNNKQQTKTTNDSIVSSFQLCNSAIEKGELLLYDNKGFYHDDNENEDVSSEMSNGLYSVTSQIFLP